MCAAAIGGGLQAAPAVFINEIHYDNAGTDAGEFIEIAGPAGTDLSGYSVVLYNGANGASYDTDALAGTIPDQNNGFGAVSLSYPANGIQNGAPDAVALVQGSTVIQFLSYEGVFTATNGPAAGMVSTDIGVSQNGSDAIGLSLQLVGAGTTYSDFTWSAPSAQSPGSANAGQTFSGVAGATVSIDDVSVIESDGGTVDATFTVTVTGSHSGITFDIATVDDTATAADADYVTLSQTGVSLPPGTTNHTFTVAVNGDSTFEATEQFQVVLSNVSGAGVVDSTGLGTITNDDDPPVVSSDVVISQVYGGGGNSGAPLSNDFIELFNRGASPVNLTGWSVQYTSSAGSGTWSVTPLSGSIAPGGYYLVRQAAGSTPSAPLPAHDASGTIAMAAGAGKVALQTSVAAIAGICPASGTADLVGYGPGASCFEGAGPTNATSNTTAALRKRGGCFESNTNSVDFSIGAPTPRNSASPARSCTFTPAAIHEIQGSGASTPYVGLDVTTTGIVTASKSNGFFLQTLDDGDLDSSTSQGIFIFTRAAPAVTAGDAVVVQGTAGEFFNLTQLESSLPGDVAVQSSGHALPAAVTVTPAMLNPAGTSDQLERFEGMRVEAPMLVSVAPTDDFGEIATVLPGVARPMREPGIPLSEPVPVDPITGVVDCCIPRFDGNPERILVDTDGLLGSTRIVVTSHVTLSGVVGPLDFSFGAYKVLPEAGYTASANAAGVPVPVPDADEFTVAGFNIENFAGNEVRRQKAALAIRQLMRSPDIIGHIEILDEATLQGLADQVNSDAVAAGESNPGYQARLIRAFLADGVTPSTQNVGFLVKTSRVRIDSVAAEPAGTFTPPGGGSSLLHDRPPLVLHATVDPLGLNPRPVIVVVNHLRSFIDIELVGAEGDRVRAKRTAQAESVAQLLQHLQTSYPGTAVISVGDYNAYQFNDGYTDPISVITGQPTSGDQIVVPMSPDYVTPNYVNLTNVLPTIERYSFIFEGTPQALDHVLVNTVAASYLQRYAVARGNSDFPAGPEFAGDAMRPEGASDHDMPVAFFRFPPPTADLAVTVTADDMSPEAGTPVTHTVTVTNNGAFAAQNVVLAANGTTTTFPSLAAGASETVVFTAAVGCGLADGSIISTTASVTSDTQDPSLGNNDVTVPVTVSNAAPTIAGLQTSVSTLWPANHKLVDVSLAYVAQDGCGPVAVSIAVTSNEPVNGHGDGNTTPDWVIVNDHLVRLRAERAASGSGRVYTIAVTATDEAGQVTVGSVEVTVPVLGGMHGDGHIDTTHPTRRNEFDFTVNERASGPGSARLKVQISERRHGRDRIDRFVGRTVTSITFSDAPGTSPGTRPPTGVDTVIFTGTGDWN
jgi:predicted extracellular nuclease